jgi:hypothetical protein
LAGVFLAADAAEARRIFMPPRRFEFKIDPKTPLKDLLPAPPATPLDRLSLRNEDLSKAREVIFGTPLYADGTIDTEETMAHVMAKMNHLNLTKTDGFMKALIAERPDLRGLPFRMGKDCRTDEKDAKRFAEIVNIIHQNIRVLPSDPESLGKEKKGTLDDDKRWERLANALEQNMTKRAKTERKDDDRLIVAALAQIFAPGSGEDHIGLAGFLSTIKHADAAAALARLALFSPEEPVRSAAIAGLKARPARDYAEILLEGFRYPLPAVAQRAGDAFVKLERKELLPKFVDVLEQPDPRAPAMQVVDGKAEPVVRELVRLNHHRNCALCHAPANTKDVPKDVLTAPVTLPGEAGVTRSGGRYGFREQSPDTFVRIDMTYLRQDFSLMMDIEEARPWHEKQRYDFFVRTRVLNAKEATAAAREFEKQPSPYHAVAIHVLRSLTGQDAGTTAQAWRRLFKS